MPGSGPEYDFCELPTIRQLMAMRQLPGDLGWDYLEANPFAAIPEERDSYHDVLLLNRLRQKLRDINLDANDQPWLDARRRLTQAINQLERLGVGKLMEKNEAATKLLLDGVFVDGLDNKRVKINLIDFDHPVRNDFLVIGQFCIDPPGVKGPKGSLRPDLILFINGIPLVVIECKDAGSDKLNQGIQDLLFYSNQRNSPVPEGIERLFYYNQLMISCTPGRAIVGTVGSQPKHYLEWQDTSPFPPEAIATSLGLQPLVDAEANRDGSLVLATPPRVPVEDLESIVSKNRFWIYSKLIKKESYKPPIGTKSYLPGEGFYYLGRSYRLKLVDDAQVPLSLFQSRFELLRSCQSQGRDLFIQWYRSHLKLQLDPLIDSLTSRVGATPQCIQIRELGNRWGSCNPRNIYFHWRVALLPRAVIEYIAVHEMIHLVQPNHNQDFWNRVTRIIPDWQERKSWLAKHGAIYDL